MLTSYTGESKPPIILLIDDLPMTNGKSAFGRLKNCLQFLVKSTQIPTAILLTDYGNADSVDYNARCLEELKLSLESSGACKVTSLKNYLLVFNACYKTIYMLDLVWEAFRLLSIQLQQIL